MEAVVPLFTHAMEVVRLIVRCVSAKVLMPASLLVLCMTLMVCKCNADGKTEGKSLLSPWERPCGGLRGVYKGLGVPGWGSREVCCGSEGSREVFSFICSVGSIGGALEACPGWEWRVVSSAP